MTATEIYESVTKRGASDFAEVVAVVNRNNNNYEGGNSGSG
jgi:hypothetical protein